MEEELNLGKVTAKFAIKFILWAILFFIIGAIVVGIFAGGALSEMGSGYGDFDEVKDMFGAINGFIYGLVVVDIIAALLATKLSIGGIAKKNKITSENRPKIMKKVTIVLVIVAIIVILIHTVIVKMINGLLTEEIDEVDSLGELIKEAEDESDDVGRAFGISVEDEFEDAIDLLKGLNTAGNIYSISGAVYLVMIPLANVFLKKKEE